MSAVKLVEFQDYVLTELSFNNLFWCWPSHEVMPFSQAKSRSQGDDESKPKMYGGLQVGNIVQVLSHGQ
eukprot:1782151-Karenia_brevis.AAC.1